MSLSDYVFVKLGCDFDRTEKRQLIGEVGKRFSLLPIVFFVLFREDFITDVNTFIADAYPGRSGRREEFPPHLFLARIAERTSKFIINAVCHKQSLNKVFGGFLGYSVVGIRRSLLPCPIV